MRISTALLALWFVAWLPVHAEPTDAAPTLIRATVQLEWRNYDNSGNFIDSTDLGSVTVGDGIEFTNGVEPEVFNIGAGSITISQDPASFVGFFEAELDEHILTFTGGPMIESAVLNTGHGVLNLTQEDVSFGSDFVSIVWADTEWDGPEVVSITSCT